MSPHERRQVEALHREAGAPMRAGDGVRFAALYDSLLGQIGDGARNRFLAAAFVEHQQRMAALTGLAFRGVELIARAFEDQSDLVRALARGDAGAAESAMLRLCQAVADGGAALIDAVRASGPAPAVSERPAAG
jgi:DNA-binding GntR family transcriptional regulator